MVWNKVKVFAEMIKVEHTIFALPFAYIGMLLGVRALPGGRILPTLSEFIWITLAMVGARTAAMALNRLIDRQIDAKNPRTATRALPQGLISVAEVWVYIILSFGLLILACSHLNALTLKLFPIAVIVLLSYSYMKRISWLCHVVLGIALGLAPLGAWIGMTGEFALTPVLLAVAVTLWVSGFDIIYACQDFEFDVKAGLHSIPAHFGIPVSLVMARWFHFFAVLFLLFTGYTGGLSYAYYLGVLVAAGILIKEHRLVTPGDLSNLNTAFFHMNVNVSMTVFFFTLADLIIFRG